MRTATATALITATLAHAAVPDKLFNFKALQVGKAANCAGAEGITLKATPEKIVWGFSDFGASIPAENPDDDLGVVFCVMENFLSHLPVGWKFSVVSATTSGTAQFTDGAWLQSMGTSTGIDVGYPEDFGVPFAERVYKFRTASIVKFPQCVYGGY
ncbi:hypothetical protein GGS20DRAFT_554878 [Poronia punctata]|nr:hypothetical protein GGS20DRAFT_554878 [Poronia punctata]